MKKAYQNPCAVLIALLFSSVVSQAQPFTNFIADQFDSDTTASLQNQGWGAAVPIILWDDSQNATTTLGPNNPGSGAALFDISWPNPSGDQVMVANWFDGSGTVLNLNNYTNVSFCIMFSTNGGSDGAGSYGVVEFGCIPSSDGWPSTALGTYTSEVANGNGWIHFNFQKTPP